MQQLNRNHIMDQSNRNHMLVEALEYYIYRMKKDNCNQAAIDAYMDLLKEIDVDYYSTLTYID
jgi:hypothetical protein